MQKPARRERLEYGRRFSASQPLKSRSSRPIELKRLQGTIRTPVPRCILNRPGFPGGSLLKREHDLNDEERLLLSGWSRNYPILCVAHRFKEGFYAIYESSRDAHEAARHYDSWCRSITSDVRTAFADLVRAFQNWMPYILNYFEHPVTNACTESLNNLIRVMNRLGRGYSFEALRAKILFTEGIHKQTLSRHLGALKSWSHRA